MIELELPQAAASLMHEATSMQEKEVDDAVENLVAQDVKLALTFVESDFKFNFDKFFNFQEVASKNYASADAPPAAACPWSGREKAKAYNGVLRETWRS